MPKTNYGIFEESLKIRVVKDYHVIDLQSKFWDEVKYSQEEVEEMVKQSLELKLDVIVNLKIRDILQQLQEELKEKFKEYISEDGLIHLNNDDVKDIFSVFAKYSRSNNNDSGLYFNGKHWNIQAFDESQSNPSEEWKKPSYDVTLSKGNDKLSNPDESSKKLDTNKVGEIPNKSGNDTLKCECGCDMCKDNYVKTYLRDGLKIHLCCDCHLPLDEELQED
jgi:hypothetical protein